MEYTHIHLHAYIYFIHLFLNAKRIIHRNGFFIIKYNDKICIT